MARIRSIKPEFWDSPSTAQAGPWARLCYIAMWNWADDYGRGTANLKELEGFIFPNDDTFTDRSGNTVNFRDIVAEVSECFGVVLYEVDGRRFYEIPNWDRHQRNERRSKESRYPPPPPEPTPTRGNAEGAEMHGISATQERKPAEAPNISGPGTGEQGNRGTGEQSSSSDVSDDPTPPERADVEDMLDYLDSKILAAGVRNPPTRTKKNRDAARLMLDRDGYDPHEIAAVIDWATHDTFWATNIGCAAKLREKYQTLRAQMLAPPKSGPTTKQDRNMAILAAAEKRWAQQGEHHDRRELA